MIVKVIDYDSVYSDIMLLDDSSGYCTGMCLTWLGDMLKKDRQTYQVQSFGDTPLAMSDCTALARIFFPGNAIAQFNYIQRGKRRHINFESRARSFYDNFNPETDTGMTAFQYTAHFKNTRDAVRKRSGLYYTHSICNGISDPSGIEPELASYPPNQGVIWSIHVTGGAHAISAVRIAKMHTFFFDPNIGIYYIHSEFPENEIRGHSYRNYGDCSFFEKLVVKNTVQTITSS